MTVYPHQAQASIESATHTVKNQSQPRVDLDEYGLNVALRDAMATFAPNADVEGLHEVGRLVGTSEFQEAADSANRFGPELAVHDRWGNRVDHVQFHPSYHQIMEHAKAQGGTTQLWENPQPGAELERAARFGMFGQIEPGHSCPISMTGAAMATLKGTPHEAFWMPKLQHPDYDPQLIDATEKKSVTFGMAMTEKQGGSDVRANSTRAVPYEGEPFGFGGVTEGHYLLTGHKWFCSAPQSDGFLVLAQTEEGLGCFLVPRVLPGGERNPFFIQRLKDKMGNKSNASSEIEFNGTHGWLVGDLGRGVRTIIEMVSRTRLDCVIGSAFGMRQSTAEAVWHAEHRSTFGAKLLDQPLMRAVIADLQLETEAAMWTMAYVASSYDDDSQDSVNFRRISTAIAKYWLCKRAPGQAYEALECLGGNGYTELFPMSRRFRESPLNGIWEGTGNVIVLDVMRALARDPMSTKAFMAFLEGARGFSEDYDRQFDSLSTRLDRSVATLAEGQSEQVHALQREGRVLVELMALLLQAAVLVTYGKPEIAEAFIAARLGENRGHEYGALPPEVSDEAITLLVDRARGAN